MDAVNIIVPIKSNSVRIPNKNFKYLNGQALFRYTLDYAMKLPHVNRIIIATDKNCEEINRLDSPKLDIFQRPKWTTESTVSNLEFINYWDSHEKPDCRNVCLLQATHPFRRESDFVSGWQKFIDSQLLTVGGFKNNSPLINPRNCSMIHDKLQISGQFYFFNLDRINFNQKLLDQEFQYFVMDNNHVEVNIDNELDWIIAEYLGKRV